MFELEWTLICLKEKSKWGYIGPVHRPFRKRSLLGEFHYAEVREIPADPPDPPHNPVI